MGDTTKNLLAHQRIKHFNCGECGAKFDTVTGLRVHMLNAYKKTMKEVPNCIPGRENPDIVVHGMEGLPKGILEEKTQKAMAEKAERDQVRAEETRERLKALGKDDKEAGGEVPPPPRDEPASKVKVPVPAPAVVMPQIPAQPTASSRAQPYQLPPPGMQARPAAGTDPEPMPQLSPSVMALLSGGAPAGPSSEQVTTVPGLRNHLVPGALAGLHPVALHVLAGAGVLLPVQGGDGAAPPASGPLNL